MKQIGWMAAAGLAAIALAGCQKAKETTTVTTRTTSAQEVGAPASATAPAGPAAAAHPQRKAGLWEMSVSSEGIHQTTRLCVDAATDAKLGLTGQNKGPNPCHTNQLTPKAGGGYALHSECDLGEAGKMTTDGTMSGDFNAGYKVEMTSTTSGAAAPSMNGTRKMEMAATWKGPCPAGMKPGDMQVAGMTMNVLEAQRRAGVGK